MHQSPSHSQGHFSRTLLAEAPHLEQLRLPGLFVRIGVDDFLCFTIVVGEKKNPLLTAQGRVQLCAEWGPNNQAQNTLEPAAREP